MGDYHHYLAEFATGNNWKDSPEKSLKAYKVASHIGVMKLPLTHPACPGLALNFSFFYHEILDSPNHACCLAKQAFDGAIAKLDTFSVESYKISILVMQ